MILAKDESFHPPSDDMYWNESGWFSFMVPERSLTGFIYQYHRLNMDYSVGGIAVWDPSGDETYNCLCYDFTQPMRLSPEADMFDFSMPSGLTVKCVEPLKSIQFSYHNSGTSWEGNGCELDLTYEGFTPPIGFNFVGLEGSSEEWGVTHYQQPGRMRGTLVLGDETLDIDCWSERDRTWGPRRAQTIPRGHFPWAIASETSGFHILAVSNLPEDKDPGIGTAEGVVCGWYLKDGEYGNLTPGSGHVKTLERGADGRPLRLLCDATDHLGRRLQAEGRSRNMLSWHGYPWMMQWWAQVEWQFDGQTAYGEEQEYWPVQQARRFIRSL